MFRKNEIVQIQYQIGNDLGSNSAYDYCSKNVIFNPIYLRF